MSRIFRNWRELWGFLLHKLNTPLWDFYYYFLFYFNQPLCAAEILKATIYSCLQHKCILGDIFPPILHPKLHRKQTQHGVKMLNGCFRCPCCLFCIYLWNSSRPSCERLYSQDANSQIWMWIKQNVATQSLWEE